VCCKRGTEESIGPEVTKKGPHERIGKALQGDRGAKVRTANEGKSLEQEARELDPSAGGRRGASKEGWDRGRESIRS